MKDDPEEERLKDQIDNGQAKSPAQKVRRFSLESVEGPEELQKVGQRDGSGNLRKRRGKDGNGIVDPTDQGHEVAEGPCCHIRLISEKENQDTDADPNHERDEEKTEQEEAQGRIQAVKNRNRRQER